MPQFLKDAKRWLPGALISIVLVAAILYFVDWSKVVAALRSANYWILALVAVLSFAWLAVRAIVWRTLLRERTPYGVVLFTLGEGYLLNNFLPFRLGEIGRAFLLSRKSDMEFAEILPTIVIERSMDLVITAAIFLAALPFVVGAGGADRIALFVGGVILLGIAFLYVLARNRERALDIFHKLSARWPALQRLGGSLIEWADSQGRVTASWLAAHFNFSQFPSPRHLCRRDEACLISAFLANAASRISAQET